MKQLPRLSLLTQQVHKELEEFGVADRLLPAAFKAAYTSLLAEKAPGGYTNVDWSQYGAKITSSTGKNIYLPNAWFFIADKLAVLMEALNTQRDMFLEVFSDSGLDLQDVATSLKNGDEKAARYQKIVETKLTKLACTDEDKRAFQEFVSDYPAWGGGKTIDRGDFYVSPLMKAGGLLAETQTCIAELADQLARYDDVWKILNSSVIGSSAISTNGAGADLIGSLKLPKPFLLLAGISGTGKSRFVEEQAKAASEPYQLVAVRPDWHEPSDLLGYVSRINGEKYVVTPFLRFLVRAWEDAFASFENGVVKLKQDVKTFWLCLDEMNLAPVEQYFADYLSILETRSWKDGVYSSAALIKPSDLEEDARRTLRDELGLEESGALWQFFMKTGIQLAPNLVVAGTVNMDETTHGFSRKVIDRAYTIDFGEFFPNVFDEFFDQTTRPVKLSYSNISSVPQTGPGAVADPDGKKSIAFLSGVNQFLDGTPFQLAYRALNELLVTVACFAPADDRHLHAVWDDFLMAKLLPRIEGDAQKIGDGGDSLLNKLLSFLKEREFEGERPDLMRESSSGNSVLTPYRSTKKLAWMQKRLEANGFTSFWP